MLILGISGFFHDAAAAVIKDGLLIAAAQEERFTRIKFDPSFPINAIRYCLDEASATPRDLTSVAYFEEPAEKLERILSVSANGGPSVRGVSRKNYILPGPVEEIRSQLQYDGEVKTYRHHDCHAAYSFYASGFSNAAVLTLDTIGEWQSVGIYEANQLGTKEIFRKNWPNSLGSFYSAITAFLGFNTSSDEYKVMGLAAYGKLTKVDALSHFLTLFDDGDFNIDTLFLNCNSNGYSNFLEPLLHMDPRKPGDPISQVHADLACSAQYLLENAVLALAHRAHSETKSSHLCLGGGVALNCAATGLVKRESAFKQVFVPPGAGDSGSSIGAAILNAREHWPLTLVRPSVFSAALGPSFDGDNIRRHLTQMKLPFETMSDWKLCEYVAKLLASGSIIGWFQGRMEFGPRALGNRSILADPRFNKTKDKVNLMIKKRESFRPFAPVCLSSKAHKLFETVGEDPFMTFVSHAKNPEDIQAVVHVDGTVRLQTVSDNSTDMITKLLKAFEKETGVPCLLNTSFNMSGEPIVCTPMDAILCFRETNLDALVLNNYLVLRNNCPKELCTSGSRSYLEYSRELTPFLSDVYSFL